MDNNKSDIMLSVKNVTMKFLLINDRVTGIKEFIVNYIKGKIKFDRYVALEDVSFEVKKGEVLGIIGRNGAGKSTLLKVVSGIYTPTSGKVTVNGVIAPMLELGAGFDYDLSGRENIFLNGAVLGYSHEYIKNKYDEIVEFAEIKEFINVPIRNYSSGMLMRLAFSIATVVVPDILIVDEILAVGDERFQKKSRARMLELMESGTTVLFVSHSLEQIRSLCSHVIWLDKGRLVMDGDTESVCDAYSKYLKSDEIN